MTTSIFVTGRSIFPRSKMPRHATSGRFFSGVPRPPLSRIAGDKTLPISKSVALSEAARRSGASSDVRVRPYRAPFGFQELTRRWSGDYESKS